MIVSDAGPLIALARTGRLPLLPQMFTRVSVPAVVRAEVVTPSRPGALELADARWLDVHHLEPAEEEIIRQLPVDPGEAAAIVLAGRLGLPLLIDERLGRRLALSRGLSVLGTVGLLLAARRKGFIRAVRPELDLLQERGVWIARPVRLEALRQAGELAADDDESEGEREENR